MTDHLPECLTPDPASPEILCICDRLRACEARVRDEYGSLRTMHDAIYKAHANALQAARDAVAAVFDGAVRLMSDGHYSYIVPDKADALAAIDALRGEQA